MHENLKWISNSPPTTMLILHQVLLQIIAVETNVVINNFIHSSTSACCPIDDDTNLRICCDATSATKLLNMRLWSNIFPYFFLSSTLRFSSLFFLSCVYFFLSAVFLSSCRTFFSFHNFEFACYFCWVHFSHSGYTSTKVLVNWTESREEKKTLRSKARLRWDYVWILL